MTILVCLPSLSRLLCLGSVAMYQIVFWGISFFLAGSREVPPVTGDFYLITVLIVYFRMRYSIYGLFTGNYVSYLFIHLMNIRSETKCVSLTRSIQEPIGNMRNDQVIALVII